MTTAILMVVVVQLIITGLHELSESRVLPSSKSEMAIIGPIVKNDIFFFITILALAAAMMLLEWRNLVCPQIEPSLVGRKRDVANFPLSLRQLLPPVSIGRDRIQM